MGASSRLPPGAADNHCRPHPAFAMVPGNADAELDWERGRGEPSSSGPVSPAQGRAGTGGGRSRQRQSPYEIKLS